MAKKWKARLIWQVSKEVEIDGPKTEEEALDILFEEELDSGEYISDTFKVEDLEEL